MKTSFATRLAQSQKPKVEMSPAQKMQRAIYMRNYRARNPEYARDNRERRVHRYYNNNEYERAA